MMRPEVFILGNAHKPQRFWHLALRTAIKQEKLLREHGFVYSKTFTEEYNNLSKEDQKKVQFKIKSGKIYKQNSTCNCI